jgi:hypothetical protein
MALFVVCLCPCRRPGRTSSEVFFCRLAAVPPAVAWSDSDFAGFLSDPAASDFLARNFEQGLFSIQRFLNPVSLGLRAGLLSCSALGRPRQLGNGVTA